MPDMRCAFRIPLSAALAALALAAAPSLAPAAAAPKPAPAKAPAVVEVPGAGGVLIDGILLPPERVWSEYRFQYCARAMIHAKPADAVDEKLLAAVVEQVIGSELLLREATRRGIAPAPGEEAAVRAIEVERWRGEEKFRTACRLLQVDEPFLIARGVRQQRVEALAVRDAGAEENLTEEALQQHYLSHRGEYLPKELPPVRYLFVPDGPGFKELVQKITDEAYALGGRGESFGPLVQAYSRHASAAQGGIVPESAAAAEPLPFSPPPGALKECRFRGFPDSAGYHFYLRDCRQPPPLAEIREKIRASLVAERRRAWVADLAAALRSKAKLAYLTGPPPPPPPGTAVAPGAPVMQPTHER